MIGNALVVKKGGEISGNSQTWYAEGNGGSYIDFLMSMEEYAALLNTGNYILSANTTISQTANWNPNAVLTVFRTGNGLGAIFLYSGSVQIGASVSVKSFSLEGVIATTGMFQVRVTLDTSYIPSASFGACTYSLTCLKDS